MEAVAANATTTVTSAVAMLASSIAAGGTGLSTLSTMFIGFIVVFVLTAMVGQVRTLTILWISPSPVCRPLRCRLFQLMLEFSLPRSLRRIRVI